MWRRRLLPQTSRNSNKLLKFSGFYSRVFCTHALELEKKTVRDLLSMGKNKRRSSTLYCAEDTSILHAMKQMAEQEEIDIRTYSIIYDAINDLKDAMEGLLSPELKEEVTGNAEIRETFKISKIGTIAGCMVTNGKIFRNSGVS